MADLPREECERRWAERVSVGDEEAFERLFYTYYEDLCKLARYYVSADVAEDLVQDVFAWIWERRVDWDLKTSLRAYLYGAVRHRALKHVRHQKVRSRWEGQRRLRTAPSGGSTDEALRHEELKRAARDALARLPERRRQVFILSRRHGLTYAEIAATLGISVKTVETHMGRALHYLREHLTAYLAVLF